MKSTPVTISEVAKALHVLQEKVDVLNAEIHARLRNAMREQELMRDRILEREQVEATMKLIAQTQNEPKVYYDQYKGVK